MSNNESYSESLVTVFAGERSQQIEQHLRRHLSLSNIRIMLPTNRDLLMNAARNSSLIFMSVESYDDKTIEYCREIQADPLAVADVVAIDCMDRDDYETNKMELVGMGFDGCVSVYRLEEDAFGKYTKARIGKGSRRLSRFIQESDYRRFTNAISSAAVSVILIGPERRLIYVSDHFMIAYPSLSQYFVRGVNVYDMFYKIMEHEKVEPDSTIFKDLQRFLNNMNGTSVELTFASGESYRLKGRRLPAGQGTIITSQNITDYIDQKHALEEKSIELRKALELEKSAREIQQRFIDMISHEFRTPLAIIDGNAELLKKKAGKIIQEDIEEHSMNIQGGVKRLTQMLEGILASNMLKAGKLHIHRQPVDLKRFITVLADDYSHYDGQSEILCDFDNIPEKVQIDQKLTTIILNNLISNAAKYTKEKPKIFIESFVKNNELIISVTDNGIGLEGIDTKKIFTRFYRGDNALKKSGSGLGLSLAKGLTEAQGGTISAEHIGLDGKGARFTITIPLTH